MSAGYAAMLLAVPVATGLLSRLLLWAAKRWNGGVLRLGLFHLISGVQACIASCLRPRRCRGAGLVLHHALCRRQVDLVRSGSRSRASPARPAGCLTPHQVVTR